MKKVKRWREKEKRRKRERGTKETAAEEGDDRSLGS